MTADENNGSGMADKDHTRHTEPLKQPLLGTTRPIRRRDTSICATGRSSVSTIDDKTTHAMMPPPPLSLLVEQPRALVDGMPGVGATLRNDQSQYVRIRRAFVTDGSTSLGRALIQHLSTHHICQSLVALATSEAKQRQLLRLGATHAVLIDPMDVKTLAQAMSGCDIVFHVPGDVRTGPSACDAIVERNVGRTKAALTSAATAGVRRFVYCSTGASVVGTSNQTVSADEKTPCNSKAGSSLPLTRALARCEELVLTAPHVGGVVCRTGCLVWGVGDTDLLPAVLDDMIRGRWVWPSGGRHLVSTTHLRNACEGLVLAACKGQVGAVYHFTDGAPVEMRTFFSALVESQGHTLPLRERSTASSRFMATVSECMRLACSKCFCSPPPLQTRQFLAMVGEEVTLDDSQARSQLGYIAHVDYETGMDELAKVWSKTRSPSACSKTWKV